MALIDNIVSYWKFDVNSATQIDSVSSNDAAVTNATFTASGKINGGYDFNGSNALMTVSDDPSLDVTSFSISLWLKSTTTSTDILMERSNGTFGKDDWDLLIQGSTGKLFFQLSDGTTRQLSSTSTTNDDGNWHHMVTTYDGVTMKLYVDNGTPDTLGVTYTLLATSDPLIFGNRVSGVNWYDGILDEIGFWNRAISASEVSELYDGGSGLQYPFSEVEAEDNAINFGINQ